MNRVKIFFITLLAATAICGQAEAQHVVSVTAGSGMTTARLYPAQEMRPIWGAMQGGVSWRYYSLPRYVGCFGLDLEWLERGFSYAPYASIYEDKKDYKYYTRKVNTIMLPVVWQPHFYFLRNRIRVYIEAAVTFTYNFCSTFENREPYTFGAAQGQEVISGKYEMRTERDNRFGYGLAGGGGVDVLIGQLEVGARVRYNFGYSDLMKNRNKYFDNNLDQQNKPGENPFWYSALRSPVDNLTFSIKVGWRFNQAGFASWFYKPPKKSKQTIKFAL